ncbi:MAG: DUF3143 domain-containing protein, partial [Cyanobium sp.]
MTTLPASATPLYNHPLPQLEAWLRQLGARQQGARSATWDLQRPDWSARITFQVEVLQVTWHQAGRERQRQFPYGLSRADVEAA